MHPFPIALDALATTAIALIAGASPPRAIFLGLGMLAIQGSIGALNDYVDADRDAVGKPGKPIAAGLVRRGHAAVLALVLAVIGLILSASGGPGPGVIGLLILLIGWLYDAFFKGTAWSWLPFAVGIPLLPVYAWLGAVGSVPGWFVVLVPAAALAGAALAIGNALVDVERDRAAGAQPREQHRGGQ